MEAEEDFNELTGGQTPRQRHAAALTDMNPPTAVALLHCFLFAVMVRSAPVIPASESSPAFREAAERAKTLVEKILRDLPAVHAATINTEGLTLDPSTQTTNLQMMVTSLGIPAAPVLKPLSERFTLDMCVSRMSAGSQLYQGLLGVLSEKLSGLKDLRVDLRDLLTHINKMKDAAQLGGDSSDQNQSLDLASRLHGNYEVQVAVHLTLTQLRSFCHDLIRSLRAVATYRPSAAEIQEISQSARVSQHIGLVHQSEDQSSSSCLLEIIGRNVNAAGARLFKKLSGMKRKETQA